MHILYNTALQKSDEKRWAQRSILATKNKRIYISLAYFLMYACRVYILQDSPPPLRPYCTSCTPAADFITSSPAPLTIPSLLSTPSQTTLNEALYTRTCVILNSTSAASWLRPINSRRQFSANNSEIKFLPPRPCGYYGFSLL